MQMDIISLEPLSTAILNQPRCIILSSYWNSIFIVALSGYYQFIICQQLSHSIINYATIFSSAENGT